MRWFNERVQGTSGTCMHVVAIGVTTRSSDDARREASVISIVRHRRAAPKYVVISFWIMKMRVEQ